MRGSPLQASPEALEGGTQWAGAVLLCPPELYLPAHLCSSCLPIIGPCTRGYPPPTKMLPPRSLPDCCSLGSPIPGWSLLSLSFLNVSYPPHPAFPSLCLVLWLHIHISHKFNQLTSPQRTRPCVVSLSHPQPLPTSQTHVD